MSRYIQRKLAAGEPLHLFVTGGTGCVGRRLTRHAVASGHRVRALARDAADDATLSALGAEPVRGALADLDVLRSEAFDADATVHLGGCRDDNDDDDDDDDGVNDQAAVAALSTGLTAGIRAVDRPLVVVVNAALAETDACAEVAEVRARRRGAVAVRIPSHGHWYGGADKDGAAPRGFRIAVCGDSLASLLLAAVARGQPGAAYYAVVGAGLEYEDEDEVRSVLAGFRSRDELRGAPRLMGFVEALTTRRSYGGVVAAGERADVGSADLEGPRLLLADRGLDVGSRAL